MRRIKERKRIMHKPTTHEIFYCLCNMPSYMVILAKEISEKPYINFLRWLIEKDFYGERTEKITIKKIATDFKSDAVKITKWIHEIYEDIFDLNYDKPKLFQKEGIKVALHVNHHDNSCTLFTSFPVLPRKFETIRIPFLKAKIGIEYFWVKNIEYAVEQDESNITIWLEGGFLNTYREFVLDKAKFYGWIDIMEEYQKHSFEIDEELRKLYRN